MFLTIFTPTYNRIKLLPRLYVSLVTQGADFEWLIIDDGSTDGTGNLINFYVQEQKIPIRYIYKSNGGKHTAFNLAIQEAKGDFLLCLDSDDCLAEGVVSAIQRAVGKLTPTDIGFIGYKAILNREMLHCQLSDNGHKGLYAYNEASGNQGEFSLIFRTELLKKYRFPEPEGEPYVTECVLFDRLEMDGYTFCPLHKVVELCEYQEDGLSHNSFDYMMRSPTAFAIYHSQRVNLVNSTKECIGHAVRYHAFNSMTKTKVSYQGKHMLLVKLMAVFGLPVKLYYRHKWKQWKQVHAGL